MKNDITAVRNVLFETMRALQDKAKPMEIERAKAICETAQAIINTAKLEVDFVRATGLRLGTGFIPTEEVAFQGTNSVSTSKIQQNESMYPPGVTRPAPGVLIHKIK